MLNKECRHYKLTDFFKDIQNGKSINELTFKNGNYPVYGSSEILFYSNKFQFKEDAIIIGRVGENCGCIQIGKSPFWASDNTIVCLIKNEYNIYYIKSLLEKIDLHKLQNGSGQPLLTATVLKSIEFSLENTFLQMNEIGNRIKNIEDLIVKNNNIINVLTNKIKDAYSFYKSNISNEIKVPLSTFLEEVNEKYTKSEIVPLLDLATIPSNSIICYLPENSSKLDTNKKAMKEGNILFGSIRPYLKKCIISPFDGATTGTVIQWKVKNEEMKCFILGVLLSNEFFDFAISNSTGTKMPVVKSADLLNFPVVYDKCQIDKFYSKTPVQYDLIIKLLKENYSLSKLKTDLLNNLIF